MEHFQSIRLHLIKTIPFMYSIILYMPHNEDRFGLPYKCKWQLHWLQKQQTENINTCINTQIRTQRVSGSHTQEHKRGHQGPLIKIKDLETQTRGLRTMQREGLFVTQEEVVRERDVRWSLLERGINSGWREGCGNSKSGEQLML